ncbi:MAG: enoyl-CoA hydratase/isomerase family protein [Chloroflexota bacterium]|nr:enoyl-CoA hydratase/isomerase family protein [Dehalococcoidia bacterium]MDW8046987.1 enoyl-CoA hydratase/isomerase family protein [Chloroflexota bacterium]
MPDYAAYRDLRIDVDGGIALITMNRPAVYNATDRRLHNELARIWLDLAADDAVRVAVVTGAGDAFSAGGDFDMLQQGIDDPNVVLDVFFSEARDIVYNMANLDKPIISAINGPAVGAGLAVALMADIPIASERARFNDGHVRLGVAAGDHACIIWPLLCGMAKAKYYLLTNDVIDGREAERIGLVSLCVPHEELMPKAMEIARRLAAGPQRAIRWTKRALNQWIRLGGLVSFEYSLAMEMLTFFGDDVKEGLASLRERRAPRFPSAASPTP